MSKLTSKRLWLSGGLVAVMSAAGCFFPPNPAAAALEITELTIEPGCVGNQVAWNCTPSVSGTVKNTGGVPTSGQVTVDLTAPPLARQDITCGPAAGLPSQGVCTFTATVQDGVVVGELVDDYGVTAVATDGEVSSPPVSDSDPLDPPPPIAVEANDAVNHSFSAPEPVTDAPVILQGTMNQQAFDRDFWQINQGLVAGQVITLMCTAPQPYLLQASTDQLVSLGSFVCDGAPHTATVSADRPFWYVVVTNDLSGSGGTALPSGAYEVEVSVA